MPPRIAGNVFLIGPMGAGKSTIGRHLAERLRLTFLDTDQEIEASAGVDIPTIFDFEGEAGFRRRETRMLDQCTSRQGVVVATGGGAVLAAENRAMLRERGTVVYLHADVGEQLRRTAHDRNRPLLQTDDPRGRLQALMQQREPLYRDLAHLVIETDGRSPRAMAKHIARLLERHAAGDEEAG